MINTLPAAGSPSARTVADRKVQDFGAKIGGARKDLALSRPKDTAPKPAKPADDRPAWQRPWTVVPEMGKYDRYLKPEDRTFTGKFQLAYRGEPLWRFTFATELEALAHLPHAECARNHRIGQRRRADDTLEYVIYRTLSNGRRPLVKGGFASEEAAQAYMAAHPVAIIEHEFTFPDVPWLESITRTGPDLRAGRDITPAEFQAAFGFRGGEFGNWNMGTEGQAALNYAFDALHDLARVLGVRPSALSLNGGLAIAFGARGHGGKDAARAHYERDYVVINLTKIRGAGSLAHEWMHAVDHWLHNPGGYTPGCDTTLASEVRKLDDRLPAGVAAAFKELVEGLTATKETRPIDPATAQQSKARLEERVRSTLKDIRRRFAESYKYNRRKPFNQPPTAEQLARFDAFVETLAGGHVGPATRAGIDPKRRMSMGRPSFTVLEELNDFYKTVTGRSFYTNDDNSTGRDLYWALQSMIEAKARTARATEGATEEYTKRTQFYDDAREIDGMRASDYWSLKHEMLARAFAAYVSDRLDERQERSDYLVYAADNRYYTLLGTKPYPEGAERERINGQFTHFFDQLKREPIMRFDPDDPNNLTAPPAGAVSSSELPVPSSAKPKRSRKKTAREREGGREGESEPAPPPTPSLPPSPPPANPLADLSDSILQLMLNEPGADAARCAQVRADFGSYLEVQAGTPWRKAWAEFLKTQPAPGAIKPKIHNDGAFTIQPGQPAGRWRTKSAHIEWWPSHGETVAEVYYKTPEGLAHLVHRTNTPVTVQELVDAAVARRTIDYLDKPAEHYFMRSERPYKLGQACDGSITSPVLALYHRWCAATGRNPDTLLAEAYPDEKRNAVDWPDTIAFAEWQGVDYPAQWGDAERAGLVESLHAINYHHLASLVDDAASAPTHPLTHSPAPEICPPPSVPPTTITSRTSGNLSASASAPLPTPKIPTSATPSPAASTGSTSTTTPPHGSCATPKATAPATSTFKTPTAPAVEPTNIIPFPGGAAPSGAASSHPGAPGGSRPTSAARQEFLRLMDRFRRT